MKVEIISCLQDNYSYLIIDNDKQEACVVDPSEAKPIICLLYTSPSPRDKRQSRMPSSA